MSRRPKGCPTKLVPPVLNVKKTSLPWWVPGGRVLPLLLLLGISASCTLSSKPLTPEGSPATGQSESSAAAPSDACSQDLTLVPSVDDPQTILDAAGPDTTVCFKRGIYRLGPNRALQPLSGQNLVFLSGAVLDGSEVVTRWTRQGSYWSSTGHHQDFSDAPWLPEPGDMCPVTPTACIYEDVFLDGRPLRQVESLSTLDKSNEVFFDKPAGAIYLAKDPAGRLVEATVAGFAIHSPTGPADDVTIRGATIQKFAYDGIFTDADRWTIQDSEIRYSHRQGIGIYGCTGCVIQNTHVHHNGVIGMTASGASSLTVQGNQFDHNNYLHAGPESGGFNEGSVKILQSHDVVFRGNWSHDNVGDGLWFDWDNRGVLIEDNLLEHNSRNGLHYEASFDATVRDNTIRDNGSDWAAQGAGILNSTSKNVEYYGNRIENNVIRSIVILWADRGQSATLGERQSANLNFHDNVIVLDDNPQSWVGAYWDQDPRVFTSNNRFQGNTYHVQKDGAWWQWGGSDLTWTEWQAIGFDTTGSYVPA